MTTKQHKDHWRWLPTPRSVAILCLSAVLVLIVSVALRALDRRYQGQRLIETVGLPLSRGRLGESELLQGKKQIFEFFKEFGGPSSYQAEQGRTLNNRLVILLAQVQLLESLEQVRTTILLIDSFEELLENGHRDNVRCLEDSLVRLCELEKICVSRRERRILQKARLLFHEVMTEFCTHRFICVLIDLKELPQRDLETRVENMNSRPGLLGLQRRWKEIKPKFREMQSLCAQLQRDSKSYELCEQWKRSFRRQYQHQCQLLRRWHWPAPKHDLSDIESVIDSRWSEICLLRQLGYTELRIVPFRRPLSEFLSKAKRALSQYAVPEPVLFPQTASARLPWTFSTLDARPLDVDSLAYSTAQGTFVDLTNKSTAFANSKHSWAAYDLILMRREGRGTVRFESNMDCRVYTEYELTPKLQALRVLRPEDWVVDLLTRMQQTPRVNVGDLSCYTALDSEPNVWKLRPPAVIRGRACGVEIQWLDSETKTPLRLAARLWSPSVENE